MTLAELQHFAGSIVSTEDVALVKRLMNVDIDAELAGEASFALFVRGGVGNQNSSIRAWFESGDEDNQMTESTSLVLAGCVRQLDDGTALRQLFEFADIYDVNVVLQQLLADADSLPLDRIMRESLSQQVDKLIDERGQTPSNRFFWTLRTYGHFSRVRAYLRSAALSGNVPALASYAVYNECIEWPVIAAANPTGEFERRVVVNILLDNIARGADRLDSDAQQVFSALPPASRAEFFDGLSILGKQS
ncbi:MAG: hypothetical protein M3N13_05430 [Candidatus Eremiobacteraeota bacterium]|nr:hypothetical protein [Candidatus Eremiobacteraeota bacterium]